MTGGHDLQRLQDAVTLTATLRGASVRVRLSGRGAGHRIPTGDPFRRFRVDLCADAGCEQVIQRVTFGRTIVPAGDSWRFVRDTTIPAGADASTEIDVGVRFPPRFWRLVYRYAAPSTESSLRDEDRETEISSGTVSNQD